MKPPSGSSCAGGRAYGARLGMKLAAADYPSLSRYRRKLGDRMRQVQQRRQLIGVDRDEHRTEYCCECSDHNGRVHNLVVSVDQLQQEQPEEQRKLEDWSPTISGATASEAYTKA